MLTSFWASKWPWNLDFDISLNLRKRVEKLGVCFERTFGVSQFTFSKYSVFSQLMRAGRWNETFFPFLEFRSIVYASEMKVPDYDVHIAQNIWSWGFIGRLWIELPTWFELLRIFVFPLSHDGYLSCCRFLDDGHILTSSGDGTIIHWDIENNTPIKIYGNHEADVMSISLNPFEESLFISGSCDQTAKSWDLREPSETHTFIGHSSDINSVQWFPAGNSFGSGSDDATIRLFDLRYYGQLAMYNGKSHLWDSLLNQFKFVPN